MKKEPAAAPASPAAAESGFGGLAQATKRPGANAPKASPPDVPETKKESEEQPASKGAEESTAGGWSLEADAAPAGSFAGNGLKLSLKAPSLGAVGADFIESNRMRVIFPATPGPYAALGLNDDKKQFREIWSLTDKRKLGQIRNLEFGSSKAQALSPDGKFFAGKPQWDSAITVFNVTQNKALAPIKLTGTTSKLVAFAGKTRLVFEDSKELRVHELPSLAPKQFIKLGGWKVEDGWAISAGGRYFAAITRKGNTAGVVIYDLDHGATAATIPLTGEPECQGVAFSPNGQNLAALLGPEGNELRVWNVKNGSVLAKHDLGSVKNTPRENYQGGRIEWFSNSQHLLLGGKVVVDSRDGKSVFEVAEPTLYPIRAVAADQLASWNDGSLINLDVSEALKAAEAAPMPETPMNTTPVAEVKPVDRSGVAQTALEEVEWAVKPGKPPEAVKARASGVEIPQGVIYLGRLSNSPNGLGYAMYTSGALGLGDDGLPTAEEGTKAWLEPLDLKNGDRQKQVPLPQVMLLMSLTPDGIQGCFQNLGGLNRLEVRATRDGSLKTSVAPYLDAEPGPNQRVAYAEFVDPLMLLTASSNRMTLLDLSSNKAVWEMEIGELRPELSPARDYVAVSESGGRFVYLVDARTGKSAGAINTSELEGEAASAFAFHSNGRFFAVTTRRVDGGGVKIIGLDDGEVKEQFPLPVSASVLQWVGDDYLLLDGSTLVSVNRECVVWKYSLPVGMHLRDSPDGRHWYIAADPARANVYTVRGVDMPDSNVVQRIGAANLRGKTLLAPGGTIDIDVQVTENALPGEKPDGLPGSPGAGQGKEFSAKVKNILTDRYQGARIKVIPGVTVKLTIRNRDAGGYELSLTNEEKPLWSHVIEGENVGEQLLQFDPPKHAFPAGAELGAGKSTLTVRGAQ